MDCAIPIGIVGGVLMFSLVFNVLSIVGYITLKMKLKSHNLENNNNPVYEVVDNNRDTTNFGNSRTRIPPTLDVEENICYSTNAGRPRIDVQENVCYSTTTDRQPRA